MNLRPISSLCVTCTWFCNSLPSAMQIASRQKQNTLLLFFLLQLEILDSELLKDFVPAGVAFKINSTVGTGEHLWRENSEKGFLFILWETCLSFQGQVHPLWGHIPVCVILLPFGNGF